MTLPITLTLRVLTPAFIGGATPRQASEILPFRPTEVRGLLRYWFRAAAAALVWPVTPAKNDRARMLDDLRELEARVFGDTTRRSRVDVLPPRGARARRFAPPDARSQPGLRYLGYGLFDDKGLHPTALVPEDNAAVHLKFGVREKGEREVDDAIAELVDATLWLWVHFGGVGARSRRGWGSLAVASKQGDDTAPRWPDELWRAPRDAVELDKLLNEGLDYVLGTFRAFLPKLDPGRALNIEKGEGPHPAIRTIDGIKRVNPLPIEARNPVDALERAGRLFQDFRSTLRRNALGMPPLPDYFAVKTSLREGRPARRLDRAAFGLPLPFFFRSLGNQKTLFTPDGGHDRVASPLVFRVYPLANPTRHTVVVVNLAGREGALPFLDRAIEQKGMRGTVPDPGVQLIEDFIAWAKQGGRAAPTKPGGRS